MNNGKKIGLVLGGGAARGLAHIGVLKILDKAGVKIDYVVGVSIGAAIGAAYALEISPLEIEKEVLKFDSQLKIARLLDIASPRKGILKGEKIRLYLDKLYGGREFKDTKLPILMLATDLGTGKEVILKSGNLANAARISISVPGVFTPVKAGKQYLIDGGVVNPTPIDLVKKQDCDIVIAVDITMKKNVRVVDPNIFFTVMQAYEIVRDQAVKQRISWKRKNIVMVTPPVRGAVDGFKFNDTKKFIRAGEEAIEKALPKLEKLLNS